VGGKKTGVPVGGGEGGKDIYEPITKGRKRRNRKHDGQRITALRKGGSFSRLGSQGKSKTTRSKGPDAGR